MRSEKLSHFSELLSSRLQEASSPRETRGEIENRGYHLDPMDEVDRASVHIETEMALRIELRTQRLAGELREALRRIRVGEFGICERCGDDIDVNRLIAQPTSTVCIDCKRRMESLGRP